MSAAMHDGTGAAEPAATDLPARGSSFYLGMRILPPHQREAMYAVYAFCREVDDIADGAGDRGLRLARLMAWRQAIQGLYRGQPDPKTRLLEEPVRVFGLLEADFQAVIDGMMMDVERDIRAPDRATFDLYCDRVAVAVGLLSVRIFELPSEAGQTLSHHLGRALQITNILRDLDEDLAMGRLYLPRESLAAAGIATDDATAILAHPALDGLCRGLAREAAAHFAAADAIMNAQPRRKVRAPRLMAAAYRSVLDRLLRRGWVAPRERVRVNRRALLWAVLRYGIG
ncbi:MAG: squalene synthase HpnD [Methylobacterium sp.]|nr:MAG: squalene synthase HpnD [Methylobacterium sp.]